MAFTGQLKNPNTGEWLWRREGFASTADWPIRWPSRAQISPQPSERWIPERAGSAVIICIRDGGAGNASQVLDWGTAEDAAEADRLLYGYPCGNGCVGNHLRIWTEPGKLHVVRSVHEPRPLNLAEELEQCYPRLVNGRRVQPGAPTLSTTPSVWPTPSILNLPFPPRGMSMNPETLRAQDAAVDAAAGRELTPEPGGLNGRAVRAHDEAEAAFDIGDIDGAFGADMLAQALTNAALCEPESVRG